MILGLGGWRSRVRELAFTSAKGVRFPLMFEDLEHADTARGTAFEFGDVGGAYVQRRGRGPRRYPLRVYFSGADHDLAAAAFVEALLDDGVAKLEHPLYGTADVVALGDITRQDRLKTEANQSILEFTLFKTIGLYPVVGIDIPGALAFSLSSFNLAAAKGFTSVNLSTPLSISGLRGAVQGVLSPVSSRLRAASSAVANVQREFSSGTSALHDGLDVLVGQPLGLAGQLINLVEGPARSFASIGARLKGYGDLLADMFGQSQLASPTGGTVEEQAIDEQNKFRLVDLIATTCVASSALSCKETKFKTKVEAITAAEQLLEQMDALVEWRDERAAELGLTDTGESYQALLDLVARTAGYLVQVSFTLLPERRIVLDRARTIVDVCAELYGDPDAQLDFLIDSNNLSGDEILELPAGRSIVYYV